VSSPADLAAKHRNPDEGVSPTPQRAGPTKATEFDPVVRAVVRDDEAVPNEARMVSLDVFFRITVWVKNGTRLALVSNESVQDYGDDGGPEVYGGVATLPVLADGSLGLWPEAQDLDFAGDRREFTAQVLKAINGAIGPIGVGVNAKGGDA